MKFKTKQKEVKALIDSLYSYIEELDSDKAKLIEENKELRWQNESLWIENKRLNKVKERYFEAGVMVARLAEKLKTENLKLKVRLDVLSKRGELKDVI